jgi:hypothetical protein
MISFAGLKWVTYFWNRIILKMNFRNLFKHDPFEPGRTGSGWALLKTYIFFLAVSIVAYAGIALLQYSLKWDMLDCYLPWRYFVGESIQNGVFPFWNPYQHLGYPIHADLRSVFYPEAIIVGLAWRLQRLHPALFIYHLHFACGFGNVFTGRAFYPRIYMHDCWQDLPYICSRVFL